MTTPSAEGRVSVVVNGETVDLAEGATLQDVVARLLGDGGDRAPTRPKGIAVALDREVVPRSAWAAVTVHEGARIEVVTAVAGG